MAKEHLKREPHNLSEDVWWYEENAGIDLHLETVCPNGGHSHESYLIPWVTIRAALKRKDKSALIQGIPQRGKKYNQRRR